ncbi:MAG: NUDIX domain-containing protein [Dehalococcoidia bacterium]|nr:NUDIX domain-containing protein [Dehalococcoidia bacterium]
MPHLDLRRPAAVLLRRLPPLQWGLVLASNLLVSRHRVGVLAVILDDGGRVLLAEHLFRPHRPWGLPGGWVDGREEPAAALVREIREELGLIVEVVWPLQVRRHPSERVPSSRGIAITYECRLAAGQCPESVRCSLEILAVEWADARNVGHDLGVLAADAIAAAIGGRASDDA